MPTLRVALGRALRQLREERGFSQEKLARLAKISRTYAGEVERGEKSVTVEVLDAFARAFNMSLVELCKSVEDQR